jgi:hypothetical protein
MKKSQNILVGLKKFAQFVEAGKRHSKHLPEKSIINMIISCSLIDQSRRMAISSLLHVCHLDFSFMGGVRKNKSL